MNLKNYYWWFDSVIPSRVCDEIVKFGVSQNSQLAITGDFKDLKELTKEQENNLKKRRNSNVAFLMEPWIFKEIHPFINAANQNAGWNFQWSNTESCQFTKYGLNQHYGWHCDSWKEPYKEPPWRKGLIRKLSMTLCLSNPKDYEGGELEFDYRSEEQTKIVTCEQIKNKGSIVVFPSFVWHRVKPVTQGTRYSLVAWNLGNPYV
jgi:PKHD-type hydroxylase